MSGTGCGHEGGRGHERHGASMTGRAWVALVLLGLCGACTPGRLDAIGTGLIAHYTFDEGSGTVVVDHSGNGRNGTLFGGTWLPDGGKFGGALHFDGTTYVTVDTFPDAPSSFTVSTWVRVAGFAPDSGLETVTSTEVVFDADTTGVTAAAGWELNIDGPLDAGAYFQAAFWDRIAGQYTYSNCTCLPLGVWTQFAFVVDGIAHTMTTYVNGQPSSVVAAPDSITPGTPSLNMGRWSIPGRMLVGDLDDLNVYGQALAADQIMSLYQAPPPDVP
jgi:hypothetical protein